MKNLAIISLLLRVTQGLLLSSFLFGQWHDVGSLLSPAVVGVVSGRLRSPKGSRRKLVPQVVELLEVVAKPYHLPLHVQRRSGPRLAVARLAQVGDTVERRGAVLILLRQQVDGLLGEAATATEEVVQVEFLLD